MAPMHLLLPACRSCGMPFAPYQQTDCPTALRIMGTAANVTVTSNAPTVPLVRTCAVMLCALQVTNVTRGLCQPATGWGGLHGHMFPHQQVPKALTTHPVQQERQQDAAPTHQVFCCLTQSSIQDTQAAVL
jgi:hypothetical protein